ncbi:MAG: HD domain-containing protein [Candidatus Ornithospirochaeta sp.]|nr:HD domain-containing protein [Candidatus Ornithospirochaeta sp.]
MLYPVPEILREFSSAFRENGYSLYLVGGAVRDYLLGRPNHDYDFTTDAEPQDVKRIFRHTIDTGIKHGTVTVLFRRNSFEVTTFRTDGKYSDSRHPESVEFVKSLEQDLERRDFTINAFAASLPDGNIVDMHGGMEDLRSKTIRAIGNPYMRFKEDALRIMRACRFAAKLGFRIEEETEKAAAALSPTLSNVSAERIKQEFFALVDSPDSTMGIEAMRRTGTLDVCFPEIASCYGFRQGGFHSEDLYEHLLLSLKAASDHGFPLPVKLAALFHDIGKTRTRRPGEKREYTFYGHDIESAQMTDAIFRRLKTSTEERESVVHLVREHMMTYTDSWTGSAVRRFIRRVGKEWIGPLLQLMACDALATTGKEPDMSGILKLWERTREEMEKDLALSVKDLRIDGKRLIELGFRPGPEIGKALNEMLDQVIENPALNESGTLERIATGLLAQAR